MTTNTQNITSKMLSALQAIDETANRDNGGDFCFIRDIEIPSDIDGIHGMTSLIGALQTRDLIWCEEVNVNRDLSKMHQIGINESGYEILRASAR